MTADQPCRDRQLELYRALLELNRLGHEPPKPANSLPGSRSSAMAGDFGSRLYETVGRRQAAHRRYRTAVRDLAECLRQQRQTG
jgi:hypothetical protein